MIIGIEWFLLRYLEKQIYVHKKLIFFIIKNKCIICNIKWYDINIKLINVKSIWYEWISIWS